MRTLSKLALVVDWQFFVDYPEWESFDMTHPGHPDHYWDDMKNLHEVAGVELPAASGHLGFWDQFSFSEDAKLYVSDANIMAIAYLMHSYQAGDRNTPPWDVGVWCFDRHHDAMGGIDNDESTSGSPHSDNLDWQIFLQSEIGIYNPINVIVPDGLRGRTPRIELPPAVEINQHYYSDVKDIMPNTFDFVFVCRSGSRVPTWCDDSFDEFVRSCPIPAERRKSTVKPRV